MIKITFDFNGTITPITTIAVIQYGIVVNVFTLKTIKI